MSQPQTHAHVDNTPILFVGSETKTITRHDSVKIVPFLCLPEVHERLFSYQHERSMEISIMNENGHLVSLRDFLLLLKERPNPEAILTTWDLREYSVLTESDFIWKVKDDDGLFKYDQLLDGKIKTAQREVARNGQTIGRFLHGNDLCTVYFDVLLIETGPIVKRRTEIRKFLPYWCYNAGSGIGYILHEEPDSNSIEKIYKYGGKHVKMGGTEYTFVFEASKAFQVDIHTGEEVQITRYPTINPAPREEMVKIQIQGPLESVVEVNQWLDDMLKNNCKDQEVTLQLIVAEKFHRYLFHQIRNVTREYCVSSTCSANPDDKICVKLNGLPSYGSNVCALLNLLTPESQQELQSVASSAGDIPEEWEPQTEDCEIKVVPRGNREWNGVLSLMKKTLPCVKMTKLERIQNKDLWEKFSLERKQMTKRNNGDVNEKFLFHGSRKIDPQSIVTSSKGIDFRFSRDRGLMWGTGAYFAENASYSDNYAHPVKDGLKQLILVRVLAGKSCSYNKRQDPSLTKPPNQPGGGKPYDTVNGHTNGSLVYVVYDHDKSYPAYIVTYKCVPHQIF